jgi:hypothetical protein
MSTVRLRNAQEIGTIRGFLGMYLLSAMQGNERHWRGVTESVKQSLDRSGGCAFCIIIGAAKVEWIRAARSTRPLGITHGRS